MSAHSDKAQRLLRQIAGADVSIHVFQGGGVLEVDATTKDGTTYHLKGDNLLKLAVELHRKIGFKVDGR
jgi:hypothetical protein